MQVPKTDIRGRILAVARQEFIRSGVKQTSIQRIAQRAKVAVGNIYNYFDSKSALFVSILSPLLHELELYLYREQSDDFQTLDLFYSEELTALMFKDILRLVEEYREEFHLLMFEAAGTPLEHFFDEYAERQATIGVEYLRKMKGKFPQINDAVSPLFVKANCAHWLFIVRMIIQNREITPEEVQNLLSDYIRFGTAGWKRLLNV